MARLAVGLLVIGLLAAGAVRLGGARYAYFSDGQTQLRQDRLTGAVQVRECVAFYVRGTESAYAPMAPGTDDRPRACSRYGWKRR
jgi:hypothetical protein